MVALSLLNILGELNTVVVEVDHRSHCFAFGSCSLLVFAFMVGRGGRGEKGVGMGVCNENAW